MLSFEEFDEPQLIGQCLSRYGKAWHHVTSFIIDRNENLNSFLNVSPSASTSTMIPKHFSHDTHVAPLPISIQADEDFVRKSETKLAWEELINQSSKGATSISDALFTLEEPINKDGTERKPIFEPIYKRNGNMKCKKHHSDRKSLSHIRRFSSKPTPDTSHKVVKFKTDDSASHASEKIFPRIDLPSHYSHTKKKKSGLSMLLNKEADEGPNVQKDDLLVLEVEIAFFSVITRVLVPPESNAQDVIAIILKQLNANFSYPVMEASFFELYMADEEKKLGTALKVTQPIGKLKSRKFYFRKRLHTSLSSAH